MSRLYIALAAVLLVATWYCSKLYYEGQTKVELREIIKTRTVIKHVKHRDGREEIVTVIDTKKDLDLKKTPQKPSLLILGLAKVQTDNFTQPIYGISISKELIGPIHFGLFAFTDKTLGISVGFSF